MARHLDRESPDLLVPSRPLSETVLARLAKMHCANSILPHLAYQLLDLAHPAQVGRLHHRRLAGAHRNRLHLPLQLHRRLLLVGDDLRRAVDRLERRRVRHAEQLVHGLERYALGLGHQEPHEEEHGEAEAAEDEICPREGQRRQ